MISLKKRILLFLSGLSLISAFFFLGVYLSLDRLLFISIDKHLTEEAAEFDRFYFGGGSEDYFNQKTFCIRNPEGLILECGNLGEHLPFRPDGTNRIDSVEIEGKVYRVATVKSDRGLYIQYALDISQEVSALKLLRLSLVLGWFSFSLTSLLVSWLFYRSTIRSFERGVESALRGDTSGEVYEEIKPLAIKLKESVDRYKDMLMALSHSLKTPIADLLLKVEILSRRRREPLLEDIRERLEELSRKITTFLRLSKVETLSYSVNLRRCNLKELLDNVLLARKDRNLKVESREVFVRCDPDLLMEVFDILVDNALKHGLENKEVLVVLGECFFVVENLSEKPVDPEVLKEPLKRGAGGVGLYIAKRLCELMGLSLSLKQSREGDYYRVRAELHFC
ncbi:signal transduction histidine kinase [Hydrogenivirga caldilitoris]|uniref:histidine kinase n=1 Tax=Hydrogenivirga caldilitoris TaxID=246264 RepID=A0A497XSF4_9AQUI|nr:HAMP domain-containing sensor histidine kinase [Hydrogenivirga caldilitoris]RLJ69853.1 signal transduction histidine kinase [Hydrogenivirga caldilitoris]